MKKARGKRVPTGGLSLDADDLFIIDLIANRRFQKRTQILREAIHLYAEANNPIPQEIKEVKIRAQSERALREYPDAFKKG